MKTKSIINIENLIPSSLLEEAHSDNESISNNNLEENNYISKVVPPNNISENVNNIF